MFQPGSIRLRSLHALVVLSLSAATASAGAAQTPAPPPAVVAGTSSTQSASPAQKQPPADAAAKSDQQKPEEEPLRLDVNVVVTAPRVEIPIAENPAATTVGRRRGGLQSTPRGDRRRGGAVADARRQDRQPGERRAGARLDSRPGAADRTRRPRHQGAVRRAAAERPDGARARPVRRGLGVGQSGRGAARASVLALRRRGLRRRDQHHHARRRARKGVRHRDDRLRVERVLQGVRRGRRDRRRRSTTT